MKNHILILTFLLASALAAAQNDPAAISVLDRFSSAALAAPSVTMDFDFGINDLTDGSSSVNSGKIVLSNDRYRLEMDDYIVWFNGETNWNYLVNEEEVTITKPGEDEVSFLTRPSSIFSMYKSGYRTRLVDETADAWVIDLYPEETDTDLIRVRLTILKSSLNPAAIEYKNRSGITYTVKVKSYDLKKKHDPSWFSFVRSDYRDAEVIDLR